MVRPLLLVGQPLLAPLLPVLRADSDVLTLWDGPDAAALARVDALVWAGEFPLGAALVDAMPRLGLIACFTVGYDGVDLDLAQALRVFRAATAAARAATAEGAGVPEYLALAAALTRLGPGDDDGGERTAMIAGGLSIAATAAALLPESWRRRARETLTSEAGIAAVGTAAVAGLALMAAAQQSRAEERGDT